jgi:aspartate aminotransferase-like enzyme
MTGVPAGLRIPESDTNLRVPGPTPVPESVAQAGARPMINHRGPEFAGIMQEVVHGLKPFFGTQSDPLLLTGSGTGAQEAAIVNVLSPGDEVVSLTAGVFGDRFAAVAEAFGAVVHRVQAEWGAAVDEAQLRQALIDHPETKAVLVTHNETSTGVTHDLPALSAEIRAKRTGTWPLLIVDGVSSIGAIPFAGDAWEVDVAITGSQKAWMSPPGLAMVVVSERAWEAHRAARMPRFYWDFLKAKKNGDKLTTPFTPAVGIVHALQEALRLMAEEGPEQVFARHERIGKLMRKGVRDLDLELFADPHRASNTVTAVRIPSDLDGSRLLQTMRRQYRVVLGSGQDWLKDSIFRIGHMGWVHESDVDGVLSALDATITGLRLEAAG